MWYRGFPITRTAALLTHPKRHYESPNSTPLWGGLAKLMVKELGT